MPVYRAVDTADAECASRVLFLHHHAAAFCGVQTQWQRASAGFGFDCLIESKCNLGNSNQTYSTPIAGSSLTKSAS